MQISSQKSFGNLHFFAFLLYLLRCPFLRHTMPVSLLPFTRGAGAFRPLPRLRAGFFFHFRRLPNAALPSFFVFQVDTMPVSLLSFIECLLSIAPAASRILLSFQAFAKRRSSPFFVFQVDIIHRSHIVDDISGILRQNNIYHIHCLVDSHTRHVQPRLSVRLLNCFRRQKSHLASAP